jgi:glutathionylspermidine synthase
MRLIRPSATPGPAPLQSPKPLAREKFGPHLPQDGMAVVEPVWKMLLSNTALLPLLVKLRPPE